MVSLCLFDHFFKKIFFLKLVILYLHSNSQIVESFRFYFYYNTIYNDQWLGSVKLQKYFSLFYCAIVIVCFSISRKLSSDALLMSLQLWILTFQICIQMIRILQVNYSGSEPLVMRLQESWGPITWMLINTW